MSILSAIPPEVLLAYGTYLVIVASPGPSNLAIMSIAMSEGRRAALTFAAGVICGSMFWATMACIGLSAVLMSYMGLMKGIKLAGGLYLLWLGYKSARSSMIKVIPTQIKAVGGPSSWRRLYLRGVGMHMTNPKAVLAWVAIVSLGVPQGTGPAHVIAFVPGCLFIAMTVFGGYAILFSTSGARRIYAKLRRSLEAVLAAVFVMSGGKLLASLG